jgi:hypothetical protein
MPLANFMYRVILQADDRSVHKEISVFLESECALSFPQESAIVAYRKRLEFGWHPPIQISTLPFPNICVFMTFSKPRT